MRTVESVRRQQGEQAEALPRQVERLRGPVTRLGRDYGTLSGPLRGGWTSCASVDESAILGRAGEGPQQPIGSSALKPLAARSGADSARPFPVSALPWYVDALEALDGRQALPSVVSCSSQLP